MQDPNMQDPQDSREAYEGPDSDTHRSRGGTKVAEKAKQQVERVREQGKEYMDKARQQASEYADRAQEQANVGKDKAAEGMSRTAEYLREHDTSRMWDDLEIFVRQHPLQAIAGAIFAGFIFARMIR